MQCPFQPSNVDDQSEMSILGNKPIRNCKKVVDNACIRKFKLILKSKFKNSNIAGGTVRMWFSVVCALIDNICHRTGQNVVCALLPCESTIFWPLWWRISLSMRVQTLLNHLQIVTDEFHLQQYYYLNKVLSELWLSLYLNFLLQPLCE